MGSLRAGTSDSKIALYQETTQAIVTEIKNDIVRIDLKKELEPYSHHCNDKSSLIRDYLSLNQKNEDKI
ncbi:hypothetical protein KBC04_03620 [Candidatus Babeliales bacterium]|nr:hypothetical protein [Candidatus Babeliales bacterium]MBP9843859.1 hypothetical protein [Candidatus Babeliales bacterium]